MKKRVFVCSPYAGDIEKNIANAKKYAKYVIDEGHNPIVPHLYLPEILDDSKPKERELGLELGIELLKTCEEIWVFGDVISNGMRKELEAVTDLRNTTDRMSLIYPNNLKFIKEV